MLWIALVYMGESLVLKMLGEYLSVMKFLLEPQTHLSLASRTTFRSAGVVCFQVKALNTESFLWLHLCL